MLIVFDVKNLAGDSVKFDAAVLPLLLYQKLKVPGVASNGVMIESPVALRIKLLVPSWMLAAVVDQPMLLNVQSVGVVPDSKLSLTKYVCPHPCEAKANKARMITAKPPKRVKG